ncbi:lipoprotein [Streptomyces sp. NBC_01275]|uniref:lipoprotein n=1 Tax=Streptomyces sp. NBC_01275 TaxID=2903807 RepID=UPI00224E930E|nr:lipoprotein [Streptomyces sp. NBC_01275]MCX4767163.1 lipoprotein [Streptomyces sp. NBC_01275]
MRIGVGNVGQGLTSAVLLTGLLTGCAADGGGSDASPKGKTKATATASAGAKVAQRGGSVGASGSACELPVTFDVAEFWKAEAVDAQEADDAGGDLADLADALLHQGPVTMACEIDAKPAGKLGYLRVWTGEPGDGDARAVLEEFVSAEEGSSGAKYRSFEAAGVTGAEVEYVTTSELLEETKKERALAVSTSDGPVVLHLGGMDTEEHEAMLPAYELAKSTLRATGA